MKDKIYFAKLNSNAKIPTKREEDGCYDIYACFEDEYIFIKPGEIKLIPTGIISAFDKKYRFDIRERGSTGTKGLARRSGQIDSGYRGEWFIPINNTTSKLIAIIKNIDNVGVYSNRIEYPYSKAIAQAALEFVPDVDVEELSHDEILRFTSERGQGALGSSGK